jgi:hypothetical protein
MPTLSRQLEKSLGESLERECSAETTVTERLCIRTRVSESLTTALLMRTRLAGIDAVTLWLVWYEAAPCQCLFECLGIFSESGFLQVQGHSKASDLHPLA